jgi:hypothetical protein
LFLLEKKMVDRDRRGVLEEDKAEKGPPQAEGGNAEAASGARRLIGYPLEALFIISSAFFFGYFHYYVCLMFWFVLLLSLFYL